MTTVELRRSNQWFEANTEGKRKRRVESKKELFERILLPEKAKLRSVLETGICESASTIWLMQNIQPDQWVGIDPWKPGRKHHVEMFATYERNCRYNLWAAGADLPKPVNGELMSNCQFRIGETHCRVVKASSHDYLRMGVDVDYGEGVCFDLVLVDADHSAPGTLIDMVLGWRKLKPGGLMIVDDFDRRWHNARPNVHEAVLAFWNCFEHLAVKEVETKKHVVIRRKLDG